MQTITPLTAFHDTARLLIHNFHFSVHYDVFIVAVEHGVSLQQLLQRVGTLALNGIVTHQLVLFFHLLFFRDIFVFKGREFGSDVGEHEERLVVYLTGKPICSLIGEIHGIEFFINHEVEGFNCLRHTAVVVLHIDFLCVKHTRLDTFFREELDERLILWE